MATYAYRHIFISDAAFQPQLIAQTEKNTSFNGSKAGIFSTL
jgi:hypothetical protein